MPYFDHLYCHNLLFDRIDHSIIPYSQSPKWAKIPYKLFAHIGICRECGFDLDEDTLLPCFIDLFEILDDLVIDHDPIAQGLSPTPLG
jgi:hypothetical protein